MSSLTNMVMADAATAKEDATQDMGGNVPVNITSVLKELYPEPITLRTEIVLRGKAIWLGNDSYITDLYQVLANWVGPRYRTGPRTNIKLIYYNREVYGRSLKYNHQTPEWRSNARHLDYHWVHYRYDENYRPDRASPNPLPNPFDKGDAWNAEAIASIEASISQFAFTEEWKQFWGCNSLFYHNQEHFERFEDQYLWELWSDGLKLMDF